MEQEVLEQGPLLVHLCPWQNGTRFITGKQTFAHRKIAQWTIAHINVYALDFYSLGQMFKWANAHLHKSLWVQKYGVHDNPANVCRPTPLKLCRFWKSPGFWRAIVQRRRILWPWRGKPWWPRRCGSNRTQVTKDRAAKRSNIAGKTSWHNLESVKISNIRNLKNL